MGVSEILTPERVSVAGEAEGFVRSKAEAIRRLAVLLASRQTVTMGDPERVPQTPPIMAVDEVETVLMERERIQSTGVGGGVAIPHGAADRIDRTIGAVLICPSPVDFDAIDGAPVSIHFAVIGPRKATGEHLKTLARVSRLLRDDAFRARLLAARTGREAFDMIAAEDGRT